MMAVPNTVKPPIVAMVGGGQLARMTHQAAIALGQSLRVLAASPDDPAAQAIRSAARGIISLTPVELPIFQEAAEPLGFELPMVAQHSPVIKTGGA